MAKTVVGKKRTRGDVPADAVAMLDRVAQLSAGHRKVIEIEQIDSARSRTVRIPDSGDPSNHVLAGDILAAENNETIVQEVVRFVTEAER